MTSADLVGRISGTGFIKIGEEKYEVTPGQIYNAANDAQAEILRELRLLESSGTLVTVSGQERYQYPKYTISSASHATPIVIGFTAAHIFQTGDSVTIFNVGGNTAANGRWPSVTRVDSAHISLDGSVGNADYTSGGVAYHALAAALGIKGDMVQGSGNYHKVIKKSVDEINNNRAVFNTATAQDFVNKYYEIEDDPIIVGLASVPSSSFPIKFNYYRKMLAEEFPSATVNPILQSQYDTLLFLGTRCHLFDQLDIDIDLSEKHERIMRQRYNDEKARIAMSLARKRSAETFVEQETMRLG